MKSKILYKIALGCGLIPLLGGLSIFCYWWAQRALYAEDFHSYVDYGISWAIFSFFLASLGLIFMLVVLVRNKGSYLKYSLLGFFVLLANIPAMALVILATVEIESRVYVKMHNQTGFNDVEYTLTASGYDNYTYSIDNGETIVFYYYPKNIYTKSESYDDTNDPNRLVLTVKHEQIIRKIPLGRIWNGGCLHLDVDKDFKLADTDKLIFY